MAEKKTRAETEVKAALEKKIVKPVAEKKTAEKKADLTTVDVKKDVSENETKPTVEKKAVKKDIEVKETKPVETVAVKDTVLKSAAKPVVKEQVKAEKKTTVSFGKIQIKLFRSLVGCKKDQIATAISLGLKKPGDVVLQPDNAATKGKIIKIRHLVTVVEK